MHTEQYSNNTNNVELLSIKIKSPQHIDQEIETSSGKNRKWQQFVDQRYGSKISDRNNNNHNNSNNNSNCDAGVDDDNNKNANNNDDNDYDYDDDHYESAVRLLQIDKTVNGSCGFHLTRSKWDPYPWVVCLHLDDDVENLITQWSLCVSGVDCFSPAAKAGLEIGDCVLEVNGFDVLGLRITEIAKLVKSSESQVTLLLWNSKCNSGCSQESLCAAPMPQTLQRLSTIVQCVLNVLECPVCRDTITPPAMQCQNGHLLCVECRIRAENCPVCRDRYYPRPALIAEQLQTAITSAFDLCRNEDKVRQKIFGRHNRQLQMVKTTLECVALKRQLHKSPEWSSLATMSLMPERTRVQRSMVEVVSSEGKHKTDMSQSSQRSKRMAASGRCNKLLTKLFNFKAYSMENLTNNTDTNVNAVSDTVNRSILSGLEEVNRGGGTGEHQEECELATAKHQLNTNQFQAEDFMPTTVERQCQPASATSQKQPFEHQTHPTNCDNDVNINSNTDCRCKQMLSKSSRHFSLSSSDLTMDQTAATTTTIKSPPMTRTKSMAIISNEVAFQPSSCLSNTAPIFSPSLFQNKTSPIWFQRRPFPKHYEQTIRNIAARHSQLNLRKDSPLPLASKLCHHSDNEDDDICEGDNISSTPSSTNPTTPSTISLKSLS